MGRVVIESTDEMVSLGQQIAQSISNNCILCFFGDLAAGKTTFIRGLVNVITKDPSIVVSSPTFPYLHIYTGAKTVFHFDLYRLRGPQEFLSMGFDEYFDSDGICCIEWSERIVSILPKNCMQIKLSHLSETKRLVEVIHP